MGVVKCGVVPRLLCKIGVHVTINNLPTSYLNVSHMHGFHILLLMQPATTVTSMSDCKLNITPMY